MISLPNGVEPGHNSNVAISSITTAIILTKDRVAVVAIDKSCPHSAAIPINGKG